MTVTVRYTCPHCGAVVSIERGERLADRSVTRTPQAGWKYTRADASSDEIEAADGVAFRCGTTVQTTDRDGNAIPGCGNPFYLNFVRFEHGVELEPDPPAYGGPSFDFNE